MAELRVSTRALSVLCLSLAALAPSVAAQERLQSSDFLRLRSVGAVRFSPDGSKIAYTVTNNDGPGGPYSQLWLVETATGNSTRVGDETSRGGQPVWSPDGRSIAYMGSTGGRAGLHRRARRRHIAGMECRRRRNQQQCADEHRQDHCLVARLEDDRVRARDTRTRDEGRERRPDGNHALSLQADVDRGQHALQRQSPPAYLPARRRHRALAPADATA